MIKCFLPIAKISYFLNTNYYDFQFTSLFFAYMAFKRANRQINTDKKKSV